MTRWIRWGAPVACAIIAACAGDADPLSPAATAGAANVEAPRPNLQTERSTLFALDKQLGLAAPAVTFAEAIDQMLAEDGRVLLSGLPIVQGRAAVAAALATSLFGGGKADWKPVRGDVSNDGRTGYTMGYINVDVGFTVLRGKYAMYWVKDASDAWKVAALVRGGSLPGPINYDVPRGFRSPVYAAYMSFGPADPSAQLVALMDVDRAFSAAAQSDVGAAFAAFAAPDVGKIDADPTFVWGRTAVEGLFTGFTGTLEWAPTDGLVAGSGDLGFTVGYARFGDVDQNGQPVEQWSKYLTIWKRQRNGTWLYVTDGGNAAPPQ